MSNLSTIYENDKYKVVVGIPPSTREFPEPFPSYLVVNKEWDVVEYFDSVLYRSKEVADQLLDMLNGKAKPTSDFDRLVEEFNKAGKAN